MHNRWSIAHYSIAASARHKQRQRVGAFAPSLARHAQNVIVLPEVIGWVPYRRSRDIISAGTGTRYPIGQELRRLKTNYHITVGLNSMLQEIDMYHGHVDGGKVMIV